MTSAAIGMLVDEGKVRWDDPVTKYLPGFELKDPWATREITALKQQLASVRGESEADPLTSLMRRTTFDAVLAKALDEARASRQPLAHFREQGVDGKRFLQEGARIGGHAIGQRRVIRIPRQEQRSHSRMMPAQLFGDFRP